MSTSAFADLLDELPASGAVVVSGKLLAVRDLVVLARRAARDLAARGIGAGQRVASVLDNSPEFLALWLGTAYAGVDFVPINTRLRGETLAYTLAHCSPRMIVAGPDHRGAVEACASREVEVFDGPAWLDSLPTDEINAPRPGGGCIIYTSGTTGRPKGVHWSAETQAHHARAYAKELVPLTANETAYSCLPLFHVTCMGVTLASLVNGATVHLDQRFSASAFWSRIAETGASFFPYVGTILSVLLKSDSPPPVHGVRFAMGAAAPADIFRRFEDRFGIRLLETYGQTELGSIWLANHDRVPGAVGRPCPRAEFRIAPVEGTEAGAGELQVRPHQAESMMRGYYADPQATAAAWTADGWYRTRDLATIDREGLFRFSGRLADCLRRRGENVSAYEVEHAVLGHPNVAEAAVVGIEAELGEQDIALYYVSRSTGIDAAAMHQWCLAHLSDFMVPRYYCPVATFPKTETQRVQKGLLHAEVRLLGAYDAQTGRFIK